MNTSTIHSVTRIQPRIQHYETGGNNDFSMLTLEVFAKVFVNGEQKELKVSDLEFFFESEEELHAGVEPLCHLLGARYLRQMVEHIDMASLTEHI